LFGKYLKFFFTGVCCAFLVFLWSLCFTEENYGDLCDIVDISQRHHFKIDDSLACDIRWIYFLTVPLLSTVIIIALLAIFSKGIKLLLKV
jgi:hypothetical protein